jgi:uncharacterized membrane protein YfcA
VIHAAGTSLELTSAAFAAAVGAALLAGTVRGFSGFGSALILSPLLSALYGPGVAVPVALLLEFALAGPFVPPALRVIDRRRTALLCISAGVTVPIGAYVLSVVDERTLRWAICALVFVAVAILAFGWRYHGRPHAAATAATGGLSGLFGGSTGLSGPPVIFYELSGSAPIATMRASFMVFFAWVDVVALVSFAVTGTLAARPLLIAVALVLPYLAAAGIGARLFGRASETFYRRLAVVILALVAIVSLPV